jgi:hypothetical protein
MVAASALPPPRRHMKWTFRWGSVRNRFDSIESASRSGGRSANRDGCCSGFRRHQHQTSGRGREPERTVGPRERACRHVRLALGLCRGACAHGQPGLPEPGNPHHRRCSACRENCDGRHVEPTTLQLKAKVQAAAVAALRSLFRNRPAGRRKALKPGRVFRKPEGAAAVLWRERVSAPNRHQFNSCTRQRVAE